MRALDLIRKLIGKFADKTAKSRQMSGLNNADCERHERRAPPPDDKGIASALPSARNDENRTRRPADYHPAVWPG
jgi:hypothetical protein